MDTEYSQIDFRIEGVIQCTAEVVKSNSYIRERVKITTSQSISMTERKKGQTSCRNPRLFADYHEVNKRVHRDITSQFRGLTGSNSIVSLMLTPIVSYIPSPLASIIASAMASLRMNPIARFIGSFIGSPMAIISPFISTRINERELIQIGTVESWQYTQTDPSRINERQLLQIGQWKGGNIIPTDPSWINERQLILESCCCDPKMFSSNQQLAITATKIVRNS